MADTSQPILYLVLDYTDSVSSGFMVFEPQSLFISKFEWNTQEQGKHLNVKRREVLKELGIAIDTSSEQDFSFGLKMHPCLELVGYSKPLQRAIMACSPDTKDFMPTTRMLLIKADFTIDEEIAKQLYEHLQRSESKSFVLKSAEGSTGLGNCFFELDSDVGIGWFKTFLETFARQMYDKDCEHYRRIGAEHFIRPPEDTIFLIEDLVSPAPGCKVFDVHRAILAFNPETSELKCHNIRTEKLRGSTNSHDRKAITETYYYTDGIMYDHSEQATPEREREHGESFISKEDQVARHEKRSIPTEVLERHHGKFSEQQKEVFDKIRTLCSQLSSSPEVVMQQLSKFCYSDSPTPDSGPRLIIFGGVDYLRNEFSRALAIAEKVQADMQDTAPVSDAAPEEEEQRLLPPPAFLPSRGGVSEIPSGTPEPSGPDGPSFGSF